MVSICGGLSGTVPLRKVFVKPGMDIGVAAIVHSWSSYKSWVVVISSKCKVILSRRRRGEVSCQPAREGQRDVVSNAMGKKLSQFQRDETRRIRVLS